MAVFTILNVVCFCSVAKAVMLNSRGEDYRAKVLALKMEVSYQTLMRKFIMEGLEKSKVA